MKKTVTFLSVVMLLVTSVWAKERKELQKAPLPAELISAKKAFLLKGVGASAFTVEGGFDLAFDAFYSDLKNWGRYSLTDKPEDADVVLEVSYSAVFELQLTLIVYNSRTKAELWSTSVAPGRAYRKSNQEKEMVKAGEHLADNLKNRFPAN